MAFICTKSHIFCLCGRKKIIPGSCSWYQTVTDTDSDPDTDTDTENEQTIPILIPILILIPITIPIPIAIPIYWYPYSFDTDTDTHTILIPILILITIPILIPIAIPITIPIQHICCSRKVRQIVDGWSELCHTHLLLLSETLKRGPTQKWKFPHFIRLTLLILPIVLIFFRPVALAGCRGYGKVMQVWMRICIEYTCAWLSHAHVRVAIATRTEI